LAILGLTLSRTHAARHSESMLSGSRRVRRVVSSWSSSGLTLTLEAFISGGSQELQTAAALMKRCLRAGEEGERGLGRGESFDVAIARIYARE
jgi:hypothetical protein